MHESSAADSILFGGLIVPYPVCLSFLSPAYEIARLINPYIFLQRLEWIFVLAWTVGVLLTLVLSSYFSVVSLSKAFKLSGYKPLIIPYLIVLIVFGRLLSKLPSLTVQKSYYDIGIIPFIVSVIVLLFARLKDKKEKKS